MLEEIFTEEEVSFLYKNAVDNSSKVTWEMLKDKGFILYGIGLASKQILSILEENGLVPLWIIDQKFVGTFYKGIEIFSSESLANCDEEYVLISGVYSRESMLDVCRAYNKKNLVFFQNLPTAPPGYLIPHNFLEELNTNSSYKKLYNLVADEESKNVLRDIFAFRITHIFEFLQKYTPEDHYRPKGLKHLFDYSVFCDCGAYNGDTFLQWINDTEIQHNKYIGIEASKKNYKDLEKTVSSFLSIEKQLYYCALGKEKGKAFFNENDTGATFSSRGDEVEVCLLNELLPDKGSVFIKMDLEGAETDTINGLKSFLQQKEQEKKGKTILAISIYHYPDELYSIPLLILEYAPSAKIYIRHHTKIQTETVCYAVI